MPESLPPLALIEAVLAVHGTIPPRREWHPRFGTARCANGIVHHAHLPARSVVVSCLRVLAQQKRIERIGTHIQVHQFAVAALTVSLSASRAQNGTCQAAMLTELAFGIGVFECVFALLADYGCGHFSLDAGYVRSANCTSTFARSGQSCGTRIP